MAMMMHYWFISVVVISTVLLLLPFTSIARPEVIEASHGAVAADDHRCSKIGVYVLQKLKGNAVDAAVATALCQGVVSPASSGIGGGGFMLIRLANGDSQVFDMRETAPLKAHERMYDGNPKAKKVGALSIAVPGEVAGLYEAWRQHGNCSWADLVEPAMLLARDGFNISQNLHNQMRSNESAITSDTGLASIFTKINGTKRILLKSGETAYNKKLAETLKTIAEYGAGALYDNKSVGIALIKDIEERKGIVSMRDLRRYRVEIRKPILSPTIAGLDIITTPPPSGGSGLILMLNILAQYEVHDQGPLGIHREIEALKHVIAVRTKLGDPDFYNVSQVLSDMLSPQFAKELHKAINDTTTFDSNYYGGRWKPNNEEGTTHLCVIDKERNAVSLTTTVNNYFGSHILSPRTGIVLNNHMDDFSIPNNSNTPDDLPPAPPNFIRPGKRPLSSVSPAILLKDGELKAVVGASGGRFIIGGVAQVLLNHFAKGMDPFKSVMTPRVYHTLLPNELTYENWTRNKDRFEVSNETVKLLATKNHKLRGVSGPTTVCQFIVQDFNSSGKLTAVSDPRKGGAPYGYDHELLLEDLCNNNPTWLNTRIISQNDHFSNHMVSFN